MRVQLSLSLHFYLLYLLLNSCDSNDAFWHHSKLVKQSSFFSRKHWTLSLQICVRQTVRLTTELVDWCRNVCTLYEHLSATQAAVTSDLKQRLIDTWASISQNVIDKANANLAVFVLVLDAINLVRILAVKRGYHSVGNWNALFTRSTLCNPGIWNVR